MGVSKSDYSLGSQNLAPALGGPQNLAPALGAANLNYNVTEMNGTHPEGLAIFA